MIMNYSIYTDTKQITYSIYTDTKQLNSFIYTNTKQLNSFIYTNTKQISHSVYTDTKLMNYSIVGKIPPEIMVYNVCSCNIVCIRFLGQTQDLIRRKLFFVGTWLEAVKLAAWIHGMISIWLARKHDDVYYAAISKVIKCYIYHCAKKPLSTR